MTTGEINEINRLIGSLPDDPDESRSVATEADGFVVRFSEEVAGGRRHAQWKMSDYTEKDTHLTLYGNEIVIYETDDFVVGQMLAQLDPPPSFRLGPRVERERAVASAASALQLTATAADIERRIGELRAQFTNLENYPSAEVRALIQVKGGYGGAIDSAFSEASRRMGFLRVTLHGLGLTLEREGL